MSVTPVVSTAANVGRASRTRTSRWSWMHQKAQSVCTRMRRRSDVLGRAMNGTALETEAESDPPGTCAYRQFIVIRGHRRASTRVPALRDDPGRNYLRVWESLPIMTSRPFESFHRGAVDEPGRHAGR